MKFNGNGSGPGGSFPLYLHPSAFYLSSPDPCIMHVDIDAFFASVEQVRNPRLRGKPVIVGSGVIASCSYEAREYGLRAGMPLARARRLCPQAVILEGHYPTYRCFAKRVFESCRRHAPRVEAYLDEAYCDLSGTADLYGTPRRVAERLKAEIKERTGLSVSVGIGTNRMIAKMAGAAGKPDGLVMLEQGREAEFVEDLPIEKLPGVGRVRIEALRRLSIATIGDLRVLSRRSLEAMFGADGRALYERCRGRDGRAIKEREIPQSIGRETTFHRDTSETAKIEGMLYYLTERAARAMRTIGLECRSVAAHIEYTDSRRRRSSRTLPVPTRLDSELFKAACGIVKRLHTRRASLHRIGVRLCNFSPGRSGQVPLFGGGERQKRESLCRCLDGLRRKYGHSVIICGKSLDAGENLRKDRYGFILRTPCLTK